MFRLDELQGNKGLTLIPITHYQNYRYYGDVYALYYVLLNTGENKLQGFIPKLILDNNKIPIKNSFIQIY